MTLKKLFLVKIIICRDTLHKKSDQENCLGQKKKIKNASSWSATADVRLMYRLTPILLSLAPAAFRKTLHTIKINNTLTLLIEVVQKFLLFFPSSSIGIQEVTLESLTLQ